MELNTALQREAFSQKNTYTLEEKQYIMQRLNEQRRIQQKKETISQRYTKYTVEEKKHILNELNDKRREEQVYIEIERKRTHNKKIYTFGERSFYKFLGMDREYYIRINALENLTSRPKIITIYFKVFGELKKKDFLMQIRIYSENIFISNDVLKVYFKEYKLERVSG